MKNLTAFLLIGMLIAFTSCDQEENDNMTQPSQTEFDCDDSPEVCELAYDNNEFGFRIFRELHEEEPDDNIFISPLSIATALSMTINGANGETLTAMQNTLGISDWELEELNKTYQKLLTVLPELDPQVETQLANAIWYRDDFSVRPEFLEVNSTYYNSEVAALDFKDPAAKDIINGWVSDNTNGLIESIVQEIPSNVVMYLINAIYFKGAWLYEFDPEKTTEQAFYLVDGTETTAEMMTYGETTLPFFETDNFMAADLAYGDSIFSMSIFLPKEDYSIDELISELEIADWSGWMESFEDTNLLFSMPKFEMKYEQKLNRPLSDLGMGIAFGGNADLSDINGTGGLYIDEVRHKSFIEVNEEGTEAAAVTSVVIVETSVPLIPHFIANKPFVFVIRDNRTNSVLFIGKMMNPG